MTEKVRVLPRRTPWTTDRRCVPVNVAEPQRSRLLYGLIGRRWTATSGHTIDQETAIPMTGLKVQLP